jgi:hypothetical protein
MAKTNLTEKDRAAIDLWTARPMTFHEGRGVFRVIPRFTPCRKPAYTQDMREDLDRFVMRTCAELAPGDFWALIKLEGKLRYVERSAVLTQKEYDDVRAKERAALGALRSRAQRHVDPGDADAGGGPPGVADPEGGGGGQGPDA